ncbi:MAG TPA: metallophosphoesterase [Micromonosporaceae bacterium]|nr:metallophosphoesterase [Micromonosporaceae bacterium]
MRNRTKFGLAGALTLGVGILGYAALVERVRYTLRRFDVPVLAEDSEPLRLLHISDLHMTPGQRSKQEWVASLAALDPDLVVVTGDNLAHPDAVPSVVASLQPLLDYPGGFVFGSNDYHGPMLKNPFTYFNPNRKRRFGPDLPWQPLRDVLVTAGWADLNNARTTIKTAGRAVELVGVDDPHHDLDEYGSVAGPASTDAELHIGVTHSPEPRVLDQMAADGFSLLLAGHTHGGQVCLPGYGALVTNCDLPRHMAMGLHRYGTDAWLHVSAGLGTSPYAPVRLACRPEATVLSLIPRA